MVTKIPIPIFVSQCILMSMASTAHVPQ